MFVYFFLLTVGMIEHYTEYWQSFSQYYFVFVFCSMLDAQQYNFKSQAAAYNVYVMFLSDPQCDKVNECLWQWCVMVNMAIILDIAHFLEIF
jgi:predicted metal-binding protein